MAELLNYVVVYTCLQAVTGLTAAIAYYLVCIARARLVTAVAAVPKGTMIAMQEPGGAWRIVTTDSKAAPSVE